MSISVCMLVKTAEKTFRRAISTAAKLGDEIILRVDDLATEYMKDLVNIAANNYDNIIVEDYHFIGFGSARNGLIHRATKDWVFMLDADEDLNDDAINTIRKSIKFLKPLIYTFPRYNWEDFDKTSYRLDHYPDRQRRLFPSGGEVNYGEQLVHEIPLGLPQLYFPVRSIHINHFCFAVRKSEDWHYINTFYKNLIEQERERRAK